MLDAYIIDQIKRREDEAWRRRWEQPVLELPLYPDEDERESDPAKEPGAERGVMIIDL